MSQRREVGNHRFRHKRLHADIAAGEGGLGESAGFECLLYVQPMVGDVGHELSMGLRLIESTHDAKSDPDIILLHEGWNDRVERALARRQAVRVSFLQCEQGPPVVQRKSRPRRHQAAAKPLVDALDQRNDRAGPVDDGQVNRVVSRRVREAAEHRRLNVVGGLRGVDQTGTFGRVGLGQHRRHGTRVEARVADPSQHIGIRELLGLNHDVERPGAVEPETAK